MVSSKSVKFPLPLGKSKKNTIESQGSKISAGRWINNEDDLENPPNWVKVPSEGYIIDRSISDIGYSSGINEYALITRYTDPKSMKPMIELLPVNSSAFDMENELDKRVCWWYKNLQPMWAKENIKKNAKYKEEDKQALIKEWIFYHI